MLVRRLATLTASAVLVLGAGVVPGHGVSTSSTGERGGPAGDPSDAAAGAAADAAADRAAGRRVPGLPDGVPAAASLPEPRLTAPEGWPFAQRISRTSGTGRLHGGASYWTDFLYDAHGAAIPTGLTLDNVAYLAPTQGVLATSSTDVPGGAGRRFGRANRKRINAAGNAHEA